MHVSERQTFLFQVQLEGLLPPESGKVEARTSSITQHCDELAMPPTKLSDRKNQEAIPSHHENSSESHKLQKRKTNELASEVWQTQSAWNLH